MENDSYFNSRNELKSVLMHGRGQLTMMGWRPLCPICNTPIEFPDMHEAIITRGHARGSRLAELGLLYVPENCVLVHPGGCHIMAALRLGQAQCIRHLLKHEGYHGIKAWLEQVEMISGGIAHDVIRKLDALHTKVCPPVDNLTSGSSDPGRLASSN
jgi:hypothetical protein